jgi:hypothetical protein
VLLSSATVSLLFSITASSQVWTFRNGFGQNECTCGGGFPDIGRAVCTDASGNVYITGKISDALIANTVSFGGAALVSAAMMMALLLNSIQRCPSMVKFVLEGLHRMKAVLE